MTLLLDVSVFCVVFLPAIPTNTYPFPKLTKVFMLFFFAFSFHFCFVCPSVKCDVVLLPSLLSLCALSEDSALATAKKSALFAHWLAPPSPCPPLTPPSTGTPHHHPPSANGSAPSARTPVRRVRPTAPATSAPSSSTSPVCGLEESSWPFFVVVRSLSL